MRVRRIRAADYSPAALRRFRARLRRKGECLIWPGSVNTSEYGEVGIGGGKVLVHRLAYAMAHGEAPADTLVLHRCDNRRCCEERHLFLGQHLDNARDRKAKGRSASKKGCDNGRAVLTDTIVRVLRTDKRPGLVMADLLGVAPSTISDARAGRTWGHVS